MSLAEQYDKKSKFFRENGNFPIAKAYGMLAAHEIQKKVHQELDSLSGVCRETIKKRHVLNSALRLYPYDVDACMRYIEIEMGVHFSSYSALREYVENANIEFEEFDNMIGGSL